MNFKEFISALFEKWACKHDWKQIAQVAHYYAEEDKYPMCHILHFKCNKCGKFKKIKSN